MISNSKNVYLKMKPWILGFWALLFFFFFLYLLSFISFILILYPCKISATQALSKKPGHKRMHHFDSGKWQKHLSVSPYLADKWATSTTNSNTEKRLVKTSEPIQNITKKTAQSIWWLDKEKKIDSLLICKKWTSRTWVKSQLKALS